MSRLDDELKIAFRRQEPSPDFAARLLERINSTPEPRPSFWQRLAACVCDASISLGRHRRDCCSAYRNRRGAIRQASSNDDSRKRQDGGREFGYERELISAWAERQVRRLKPSNGPAQPYTNRGRVERTWSQSEKSRDPAPKRKPQKNECCLRFRLLAQLSTTRREPFRMTAPKINRSL